MWNNFSVPLESQLEWKQLLVILEVFDIAPSLPWTLYDLYEHKNYYVFQEIIYEGSVGNKQTHGINQDYDLWRSHT